MADLIQAPAERIVYDGIDNPIYDQDLVVATQNAISLVLALSGADGGDFFIISGLYYVPGVPNTYTPGFFILGRKLYVCTQNFVEGSYLGPNVQPTQNEGFNDGTSRNIYQSYGSLISPTPDPTYSPQFEGNMNQYRIGNKYLGLSVISLLATQASLGNASTKNVGTTAGTVAAGDDPRMPYTAAQLAALFVMPPEVILKGDTNAYTPAGPNDPVNKNYTDTNFIKKLASGNAAVGDVPSGGKSVALAFGVTLPDTNYIVLVSVVSAGVPGNDASLHTPVIVNKTTAGCSVQLNEGVGTVQNVSLDWIVLSK